jgi:hypothetical protein
VDRRIGIMNDKKSIQKNIQKIHQIQCIPPK